MMHSEDSSPSPKFPERISKDEINALPIFRYTGPVRLVRTEEALELARQTLLQEEIIGFDTETRPVFKRGESYPTSLIQMATAKEVFLFQLNELDKLTGIKSILSNPDIKKVGVALRDDFVKLRELENFTEQGVVDIAKMSQGLGIVNTGLRSLAAILLNQRISKSVQVSNWAKRELTPAQITYAATDAWVSREIYLKLIGNSTSE
ncbi:MAG: 3'-5' exonuclease [Verrucomicrobiota bacterium]